jgi:hypothetical protein
MSLIKLGELGETYRIVHTKTGLFFNGYDKFYSKDISSKGKNTLSKTNSKNFFSSKKDDVKILEEVFEGNIVMKNDKQYVRNIIVYAGSEIHMILSEYYNEYEYLPIADFTVERKKR